MAPFYCYPDWREGRSQCSICINELVFNALAPEYKAVVEHAASTARITLQAGCDAKNTGALQWATEDPGRVNNARFDDIAENRSGFLYRNSERALRIALALASRPGCSRRKPTQAGLSTSA